jgi:dTDP-4-dehydrorhamnose reductase
MHPILVWGRQGLLAQAIRRNWANDGKILFWGRHDLPATRNQQHRKICRLAPSAIVNASGFTNLIRTEATPHLARELHVETPAFLAAVSRDLAIPFITASSDYVFSGHGRTAWTENDRTEPINAYGRSKLEGERAVMAANPNAKIIRTAGLFGPAPIGSKVSFPERILQQVRFGRVPEVRSDLTTSICHVDDLAIDMRKVLNSSSIGFFHIAHAGGASWLQIANHALESAGVHSRVQPIQTPDFPRPECSTLATQRPEVLYGNSRGKTWQQAIGEFMRGFCDV